MKIEGNFIVTDETFAQCESVEEVSGDLLVLADGAHLRALRSVGGSVQIATDDTPIKSAFFPVLADIGGFLHVRGDGVKLPMLTIVGDRLAIVAATPPDLPKFEDCRWHGLGAAERGARR